MDADAGTIGGDDTVDGVTILNTYMELEKLNISGVSCRDTDPKDTKALRNSRINNP